MSQTLVHICCSVDSHHFLTQLRKLYPNKEFCGFFYNPNIHPYEEYLLRLEDVKRSCKMLGIPLIVGEYDVNEWICGSKGLEDAPEKGERCSYCFDFRLERSAKVALEQKCTEFTTTLLASPMKSQAELFAQGENLAKRHNLAFLCVDVRKNGGTKIQNELAKEAQLYRQNYCGCLYALKAQRNGAHKEALELFSVLNMPKNARNLPNERLELFKIRQNLEQTNTPYFITKRKVMKYRLLSGILMQENSVIPSFICNFSQVCQKMLKKPIKAQIEHWENGVGYANKEGILLVIFDYVSEFLGVQSFRELLSAGLSEEAQLNLRHKLYPHGFCISPIVIVESCINDFSLELNYIMQEEMIEDFITSTQ